MLNITCTTDPISGKEVSRGADRPNVRELGNETDLTIYFESEANRLRSTSPSRCNAR